MSVEQLESNLLRLSRDERRRFIEWFYRHEHEIFEAQEEDRVSPEIESEILRRGEELRANPGLAVPVTDDWFENLKRRLPNASAFKASSS